MLSKTAHHMQVSGESVDEYKLHVRDGLRRLLDHPGDGIGGLTESIVVYVKPSSVDAYSKGPGKVWAIDAYLRLLRGRDIWVQRKLVLHCFRCELLIPLRVLFSDGSLLRPSLYIINVP